MLKTVGFPSSRTGDQTIIDGNLVIGTAGKGIDFSATSGTGTSELFSDYEEGTWTPNQGPNLIVVGTFSSSGRYTKVGRVVQVQGVLTGSTSVAIGSTGAQMCTNLPFSCSPAQVGTMASSGASAFGGTLVDASIVYSASTMAATSSITFSVTYSV